MAKTISRTSWLAAMLALGMLAASCGGGGDTSTTGSSTPTTVVPATTVAPRTTTSLSPTTLPTITSPPDGASQTAADAERDGVVAAVAELPMSVRVDIIDEIEAEEGVWAISRLTAAADELADGCRLGPEDGKYPTDFICTTEYGEVLLLSPDRETILRAYPLPGVPAEIITIDTAAVYCGRQGKLPMPDVMLCRIDRQTLAGTVAVYQTGLDSLIVQPCFFPPDSWRVVAEDLEVTALVAGDDGLFVRAGDGSWTRVDLADLSILERDAPAPPGYDS